MKKIAMESRGKPWKLTMCRRSAVVLVFSIRTKFEEGHMDLHHMVDDVYSKINRVKPQALSSMTSLALPYLLSTRCTEKNYSH